MPLFAIKTRSDSEHTALEFLYDSSFSGVHSAFSPPEINGYIFIEASDEDVAQKVSASMPQSQKLVRGETDFTEISHFLSQDEKTIDVEKGEEVNITSGGFEGKTGIVKHVDREDNEVTVEVSQETIPIPITLSTDNIRKNR